MLCLRGFELYSRWVLLNPVCRQCGGSHESRYMLRIFNKAGSCKDLYSKVYKTCGKKISFPVPPSQGKAPWGGGFRFT